MHEAAPPPETGGVVEQLLKGRLLGVEVQDPRIESADVDERRAFLDDLIRELGPLFDAEREIARSLGSATDAGGLVPVESSFETTSDKFWGAVMPDAIRAIEPTLRKSLWDEKDIALTQRFAEYVALGPTEPIVLTGTDQEEDARRLEAYAAWFSERMCDCQFQGGLSLSFTGGPYQPTMLDETAALPEVGRQSVTPDLELRICEEGGHAPRIQAVDSSAVVLWTCELRGVRTPLAFTGEVVVLDRLGWNIPLTSGRRPTSLFLDGQGQPCYYFVAFD